jgi:Secretion system C-terminal sorting domain
MAASLLRQGDAVGSSVNRRRQCGAGAGSGVVFGALADLLVSPFSMSYPYLPNSVSGWSHSIKRLLLGAVGLLAGSAPAVQAQAPRIAVDHFYPHTVAGYPTGFNDAVFTPQGNILASGPQNNNPLDYFHNRFLLLSSGTLDTVWATHGLDMILGPQRLVSGPGNQYTFCGYSVETGNISEWSLQTISLTGRIRRTVQIQNPGGWGHNFGAAIRTPDGGLLWAGTTPGASARRRAELLRTDSVGTVLWRKEQGWSVTDYQTDAAYTNTGTVLLSGLTPLSNVTGTWSVRLLEVNAQGDSLRGVVLAPRGTGTVAPQYGYHRLLPLADGGFVLPCDGDTVVANGSRQLQPLLLKVDRQLRVQWLRAYRLPRPVGMRYTGAVALADGSILVLAYGGTGYTYYLHHYDAQGRLLAEYPFVTTACPNLTPIKLLPDPTGRYLLVAGGCEGSGAYAAMIDLRGLPNVVTAASPSAPAPAVSFAVYPNPATDQATAQVQRAGTLRLLDAVGRVVVQQSVRTGQNRLDLAALPAGLYACQLVQDGRVVALQRLQVVH